MGRHPPGPADESAPSASPWLATKVKVVLVGLAAGRLNRVPRRLVGKIEYAFC
jgi:hypothetical protein